MTDLISKIQNAIGAIKPPGAPNLFSDSKISSPIPSMGTIPLRELYDGIFQNMLSSMAEWSGIDLKPSDLSKPGVFNFPGGDTNQEVETYRTHANAILKTFSDRERKLFHREYPKMEFIMLKHSVHWTPFDLDAAWINFRDYRIYMASSASRYERQPWLNRSRAEKGPTGLINEWNESSTIQKKTILKAAKFASAKDINLYSKKQFSGLPLGVQEKLERNAPTLKSVKSYKELISEICYHTREGIITIGLCIYRKTYEKETNELRNIEKVSYDNENIRGCWSMETKRYFDIAYTKLSALNNYEVAEMKRKYPKTYKLLTKDVSNWKHDMIADANNEIMEKHKDFAYEIEDMRTEVEIADAEAKWKRRQSFAQEHKQQSRMLWDSEREAREVEKYTTLVRRKRWKVREFDDYEIQEALRVEEELVQEWGADSVQLFHIPGSGIKVFWKKQKKKPRY